MHSALLEAGNVDHRWANCFRAPCSSLMHARSDWVSDSPDVAAKSSLQLLAMSNAGTPSATATTNCVLRAIIATEIGILYSPTSSAFLPKSCPQRRRQRHSRSLTKTHVIALFSLRSRRPLRSGSEHFRTAPPVSHALRTTSMQLRQTQ